MSDLAHEDTESGFAPEITENTGATIDTANPDKTNSKNNEKPNLVASLLMKVWSAIMLVSTAVLGFYFFVLKDNSAAPFVVLGVVGLCLPPIVNMFRTMARNKQLRIEREERIRKAALERSVQAKERERKRRELEESAAANAAAIAAAEQDAIKNFDVEAYKFNNSIN